MVNISKEVFNKKKFMKIASRADDIWLKAMSIINHYPTRKINTRPYNFRAVTIPGSQNVALKHYNYLQGKYDGQIKNVFDYYHIEEKIQQLEQNLFSK